MRGKRRRLWACVWTGLLKVLSGFQFLPEGLLRLKDYLRIFCITVIETPIARNVPATIRALKYEDSPDSILQLPYILFSHVLSAISIIKINAVTAAVYANHPAKRKAFFFIFFSRIVSWWFFLVCLYLYSKIWPMQSTTIEAIIKGRSFMPNITNGLSWSTYPDNSTFSVCWSVKMLLNINPIKDIETKISPVVLRIILSLRYSFARSVMLFLFSVANE